MFLDPQSVTISAVAQSMPRVEIGNRRAVYQKADGTHKLTISHQATANNRIRTNVRLDKSAVVPDPLTAVNDTETFSVYLVIDRPIQGFSALDIDAAVQGFKAWLTTAAITQLYGQES